MKGIRLAILAALAAALAIPAASTSKSNGPPTTIGPGEGALNLIEWAA
jgi:hypothetical protein